jgi:hypothetical protein
MFRRTTGQARLAFTDLLCVPELLSSPGPLQWFRYLVGATETTGAVFLFTPDWSGVAAMALAPLFGR